MLLRKSVKPLQFIISTSPDLPVFSPLHITTYKNDFKFVSLKQFLNESENY
jgi:hypothetical protein